MKELLEDTNIYTFVKKVYNCKKEFKKNVSMKNIQF